MALAARRLGLLLFAALLSGVAGLFRTIALAAMDGERLISRYDWLYGWTPA